MEKILSDPNQKVFVSLEWEKIVWFANCGKSVELDWYDCTLFSMYLLAGYQWKSIGSKLFCVCKTYLQSLWCQSMYVWVLDDNTAKQFYGKMGGKYVSKKELLIGQEKYVELSYDWKL
jgi:L-amino acid N-acyltransferase YncA